MRGGSDFTRCVKLYEPLLEKSANGWCDKVHDGQCRCVAVHIVEQLLSALYIALYDHICTYIRLYIPAIYTAIYTAYIYIYTPIYTPYIHLTHLHTPSCALPSCRCAS